MTHTPEVRKRIGESSKLRWADPEYRKRLRESQQRAQTLRRAEWARKAESAILKGRDAELTKGKKRQLATLKCQSCESDFVPKVKRGSNAQKYCSEKCRNNAYFRRKRRKPEYRAKMRERWENDAEFREKRRADWERWRRRNPEKAKAARLKWVSKNLEHLAEYQRLRREENPEKFRQQRNAYYHRLRDAARRKAPGAKRNPMFAEAYRLRQKNVSWGQIAIKLLPSEYRTDADRTVDKLKKGVKYLRETESKS